MQAAVRHGAIIYQTIMAPTWRLNLSQPCTTHWAIQASRRAMAGSCWSPCTIWQVTIKYLWIPYNTRKQPQWQEDCYLDTSTACCNTRQPYSKKHANATIAAMLPHSKSSTESNIATERMYNKITQQNNLSKFTTEMSLNEPLNMRHDRDLPHLLL